MPLKQHENHVAGIIVAVFTIFFQRQSAKKAKTIESTGASGRRHKACGIQARFPIPPAIHDWTAEALFLTGMYVGLIVMQIC